MKLNNKGFAASGVLYTLLLLFLVLIVSLLSMFSNRKLILERLKKSIVNYNYKKYENGTIIYFNPTTGLKCDIEDYNQNVDDLGVSIGSNSNTKDGCMKWYAFNDDEKSEKINLLLDHNIVSSLSYESNDNVNEKLLESTETWNDNISDIKLLSVNDIKKITSNMSFDISNLSNKYYFETNTSEVPSEYKNYGWLYDRTGNDCKKTGCKNNSNDDITGYITSNNIDNKVWVVNKDGSLMTTDFTTDTYGLRPTIIVTKALIHDENKEYEKDIIAPVLLNAELEKLGKINYTIQDNESGLKAYCVNNSTNADECIWTTVTNTTEEFSFVYNADKVGDYYIHIKDNYDNIFTSNSPVKVTEENMCEFDVNKTWTFDYKGSEEVFNVPCNATYKIELWGAQGGNNGGKGAYTSGIINLNKEQQIYIYVGGAGSKNSAGKAEEVPGGYNGGGLNHGQDCCERVFGSGGGATDIRLVKGTWNNFDSLKSRIMVASGGGGTFSDASTSGKGGAGGTINGVDATGDHADWCNGLGATQTKGGSISENTGTYCTTGSQVGYTDPGLVTGKFGMGGTHGTKRNNSTGGGSGYYGGSSSGHIASAGGGSSFISGHTGCDAINETSTQSNIIHTGQPNHYSGLVFKETNMIAGNETMPTHDGQSTMIGNSGNGYAKITYLES